MAAWRFYFGFETSFVIGGYLMGVLLGELLAAPKPNGRVRIASLRPRTGRNYAPRWPTRVAVAAALVTAVSPLLFALLPRLHYASYTGLPAETTTWPTLTISASLALGVLLVGAAVVERLVSLPPVMMDRPISEQARNNSVRAAVRAVLGIELLLLADTMFGASLGFHTPYPDADLSPGWVVAGWAFTVLDWGGTTLMIASVVVACALGRWRRPPAVRLATTDPHPARA